MAQNNESIVWGIHGGKGGNLDSEFLSKKTPQVLLGFVPTKDLSALPKDREAFKKLIQTHFPGRSTVSIGILAGQLYRFVHELQMNDIIVYPSPISKKVNIGKISGGYLFRKDYAKIAPHQRPVNWLRRDIPRTHFSQSALNEIGAALAFFQIANNPEEFRSALEGAASTTVPKGEEAEFAQSTQSTEEETRDFIRKQLEIAFQSTGKPFEAFVAGLLRAMGFRTRETGAGPDGGIDIIAHKDELCLQPPIIKVQVKSGTGTVSDKDVSSLAGKKSEDEYGLVVALGSFSAQAKHTAQGKARFRLVDEDDIVELVLQNYEQLDPKFKGIIPLKKIYVPDPKPTSELSE
jgi:restriction system protein